MRSHEKIPLALAFVPDHLASYEASILSRAWKYTWIVESANVAGECSHQARHQGNPSQPRGQATRVEAPPDRHMRSQVRSSNSRATATNFNGLCSLSVARLGQWKHACGRTPTTSSLLKQSIKLFQTKLVPNSYTAPDRRGLGLLGPFL